MESEQLTDQQQTIRIFLFKMYVCMNMYVCIYDLPSVTKPTGTIPQPEKYDYNQHTKQKTNNRAGSKGTVPTSTIIGEIFRIVGIIHSAGKAEVAWICRFRKAYSYMMSEWGTAMRLLSHVVFSIVEYGPDHHAVDSIGYRHVADHSETTWWMYKCFVATMVFAQREYDFYPSV